MSYPKTFHIGFIQPSEAQVDEINQRLKEDGFDVEAPSHQHGAWAFSFQAPGRLQDRGADIGFCTTPRSVITRNSIR